MSADTDTSKNAATIDLIVFTHKALRDNPESGGFVNITVPRYEGLQIDSNPITRSVVLGVLCMNLEVLTSALTPLVLEDNYAANDIRLLGIPLLHYTVLQEHELAHRAAVTLLMGGVDVLAQDDEGGCTAAMVAIAAGNREAADQLKRWTGPEEQLDIRNKDGNTIVEIEAQPWEVSRQLLGQYNFADARQVEWRFRGGPRVQASLPPVPIPEFPRPSSEVASRGDTLITCAASSTRRPTGRKTAAADVSKPKATQKTTARPATPRRTRHSAPALSTTAPGTGSGTQRSRLSRPRAKSPKPMAAVPMAGTEGSTGRPASAQRGRAVSGAAPRSQQSEQSAPSRRRPFSASRRPVEMDNRLILAMRKPVKEHDTSTAAAKDASAYAQAAPARAPQRTGGRQTSTSKPVQKTSTGKPVRRQRPASVGPGTRATGEWVMGPLFDPTAGYRPIKSGLAPSQDRRWK